LSKIGVARASAAALADITPEALSSDPGPGAVRSCRECRQSAEIRPVRPFIPSIGQPLSSPALAVEQLLDDVGNWLSSLPAGPATDFLAGGLLLVRRGLFNQTPTVAPRVLVGEVLRPMRPEEGSTFSTSLVGEVVGTLGAVDPEGAVLSYALSRSPQFGVVRVDPDGTWSYTPSDASAALEDAFTVSINDGGWNILDPFASPAEVTVGVRPGLSSSSNKPGLIASDWLEVVKETGEFNGDEPIMLTVVMTTTLGVDGSTSARVVNKFPGQTDSGMDAGNKKPIPDKEGDVWIDYSDKFKPLTLDAWSNTTQYGVKPVDLSVYRVNVTEGGNGYDSTNPPKVRFEGGLAQGGVAATGRVVLTSADGLYRVDSIEITDPGRGYVEAPTVVIDGPGGSLQGATATASIGAPVPLPLILVATLMLEGDFSPGGVTGDLATPVIAKLKIVGEELENTKIYVPDILDGNVSALTDASKIVKQKVELTGSDYVALAVQRIRDWTQSIGDPDDPVAVGVTGLIPVDGTFIDGFPDDLRTLKIDNNVQLSNFMYSTSVPVKVPVIWDFDLATRFGFLVPPSYTDKRDPLGWETTYAGDYVDNFLAVWKVETQAWPRVNW
jgi:hypothetical protein